MPSPEDLPELPVPETMPLPAAGSDTLPSGLGERYESVARLGAGAFGAVYRARDRVLGRDVAIKTIRLEAFVEPAQLEEVKKRFLREAQVAAGLRHPSIVTTHDIVETPSTSFIVMELVEGRTLQELLLERGRLGLDDAVAIIGQAAAALDHAHASGVVHRDVKPANIMVETDGHVKVMDFGIAKVETGQNLTSTGLILGTPNYMSPEQARGHKLDARSDLFSLGCVLYECLTGVKPFQGDTVTAILVKIITEEPPPVDFDAIGLPRRLGPVLRRATAKDPAARFASAAEMMAAVRAAAPTLAAPATVVSRQATPARVPGTAPAPASAHTAWPTNGRIAAAVALLTLLGGGLWMAGQIASGARSPAPEAASEHTPLVVHEQVGTLGRLLGRKPRLLVTLPSATPIHARLEAPLSSETARPGDEVLAEIARPIRIEGIAAVPAGSRLVGQVTHAAPAAESGGRGEMTLEFETIELPGGERVTIHASPLSLRAPATKRKDAGVIAGLAGIGAAVGGLIGGKKGAVAGTVVGGAAGVGIVKTDMGQEVTLTGRSRISIGLVEPVTVARPAEKSN